jgi:hypothetical protein
MMAMEVFATDRIASKIEVKFRIVEKYECPGCCRLLVAGDGIDEFGLSIILLHEPDKDCYYSGERFLLPTRRIAEIMLKQLPQPPT